MKPLVRAALDELRDDPDAAAELREILDGVRVERLLNTTEAAERLGVHPDTLTKAAREGRVRGAVRQGVKLWRFKPSELEMLPPLAPDISTAGPRRASRRPGKSAAASAMLAGATRSRAA